MFEGACTTYEPSVNVCVMHRVRLKLVFVALAFAACSGERHHLPIGATAGQGVDSSDSDERAASGGDTSVSATAGLLGGDTPTTGDDTTGADSGATSNDSTGSEGDPPSDGVLPNEAAGCGQPLAPGWLMPYTVSWGATTQSARISAGGVSRDYIVQLPRDYDPNHVYPLQITFHAWGSDMDSGFGENPEQRWPEPVIAIAPRGQPIQGGGHGWQWWEPEPSNRDYDFMQALLVELSQRLCIDMDRIFLQGTSNGGYFAQALSCRYGEEIRATAVSASGIQLGDIGLPPPGTCLAPRPQFLIHGRADTVVPIAAGQAMRNVWLSLNGCNATTTPLGVGECVRYNECTSGQPVVWCTHPGGHSPGAPEAVGLAEAVAAFFAELP